MSSSKSKQLKNGAEKNEGLIRTEMYCHDCSKQFIAIIDYSIDGNHIIICPHCGHQHCRKIEDGVVTETRWDSMSSSITDRTERIWTDTSLKMKTSSTSHFLREKWLNFGR